MAEKQLTPQGELEKSDAAIKNAVHVLSQSYRGKAVLKSFQKMWLGYNEGYQSDALSASGLDSRGQQALLALSLEACGGRRDFLSEL